MRKLTGAVFVSLDGVMQAPGGPDEDPTSDFRFGGWVQPFWSEEMGPFEAVIMGEYDLLLGKRTYDIFAAYWPHNQDNPIGEKFQRVNKYVLTHSNEPLEWEHSHKLSGDTASAIAELKHTEGRDLLIQGRRDANGGGEGIEDTADRVEILIQRVACHWLDEHQRSIRL